MNIAASMVSEFTMLVIVSDCCDHSRPAVVEGTALAYAWPRAYEALQSDGLADIPLSAIAPVRLAELDKDYNACYTVGKAEGKQVEGLWEIRRRMNDCRSVHCVPPHNKSRPFRCRQTNAMGMMKMGLAVHGTEALRPLRRGKSDNRDLVYQMREHHLRLHTR